MFSFKCNSLLGSVPLNVLCSFLDIENSRAFVFTVYMFLLFNSTGFYFPIILLFLMLNYATYRSQAARQILLQDAGGYTHMHMITTLILSRITGEDSYYFILLYPQKLFSLEILYAAKLLIQA